jgi:hypothetical protein
MHHLIQQIHGNPDLPMASLEEALRWMIEASNIVQFYNSVKNHTWQSGR